MQLQRLLHAMQILINAYDKLSESERDELASTVHAPEFIALIDFASTHGHASKILGAFQDKSHN